MPMKKADYELEYPAPGVYMDTSKAPVNLPPGVLRRIVGIDGRHKGTLRKYPGNISVASLGLTSKTITFFQSVVWRLYDDIGKDMEVVRGFLVRYYTSAGDFPKQGDIVFYYRRETDSVPKTISLVSDAAMPAGEAIYEMSVTSHGNYLYVFINDRGGATRAYPRIYYKPGATLQEGALGPYDSGEGFMGAGDLTAPVVAGTPTFATGGFLNFRGVYQVAYRFYHTARKVHTGLSAALTITMDQTTGNVCKAQIDIPASGGVPDDADADNWDTCQIFRTQNLINPFDPYQGGVFYLESSFAVTDATAKEDKNVGTLHDVALVQQERYDPWADPITAPPDSGACAVYNGSLFAAKDPDTDAGIGVVWSNPGRVNMEEFGSEYGYDGRSSDGIVKKFIPAGESLFGLTSNLIYKIQKLGGDVAITRLQEGRSLIAKNAAINVDQDLMVLMPQGLALMSGINGSMQIVSALDEIILEDWAGTMTLGSGISMAYDSLMGCTYILNPYKKETICVWDATKTVSMLEGTDFRYVTSGVDMTWDSGALRAYFITDLGLVVAPDYDRSSTSAGHFTGSMLGKARSNTTASSEVAVATLQALAVDGTTIFVTGGSQAGKWASELTGALEIGSTYCQDPIVVKLRWWPISLGVRPRFTRKVLKGMTIKAAGVNSYTGNPNDFFRVSAYRDQPGRVDDSLCGVDDTITMDDNPSDSVSYINVDGITIEPYVEQGSCGTDFELTGLLITGTITESEKVTGA